MDFRTLIIGNIVTITLNTSNQLIGEISAFDEQSERIILKNVRFQYNESEAFGKSSLKSDIICEELSIKCQHIVNLKVVNEITPESNVVQAIKKSNKIDNMPHLTWIPGKKPVGLLYQAEIQKQLQTSMKDFCKKLFDNSNFAQLISQQGKKIEIGLPKYFARFHREPTMSNMTQFQLNIAPQYEQDILEQGSIVAVEKETTEVENLIEEIDERAEMVSEPLDEQMKNCGYPFIKLHQFNFNGESNLEKPVKNECHVSKISDFPNCPVSPFLRYSNGDLYLNEEYFRILCQSDERVETEELESVVIEDITNIAVNCQEMGQ